MDIFNIESEKCTGCGICVKLCPLDNIRLDENGFPNNRFNECWYCGTCEIECPTRALELQLPFLIR